MPRATTLSPSVVTAVGLTLVLTACGDAGTSPPPALEGVVEGTVRIEGAPRAEIDVRLTPSPSGSASLRRTDAAGAFRFEGLEAGPYSVRVEALVPAVFAPSGVTASLTREHARATIDFAGTWQRDAGLSVRVEAGGTPVSGAMVTAAGPREGYGEVTLAQLTDLTGTTAFTGLVPGSYELTLSGIDPAVLAFDPMILTVTALAQTTSTAAFAGERLPQIPTAPGSLSLVLVGSDAVALSWTGGSTDETRFDIERRDEGPASAPSFASPDDGFAVVATLPAGSTGWVDSGLEAGRSYSYRVRACNQTGCSAASTAAAVTTPPPPPSAPTALIAHATGPTSVSLGWSDTSDDEAEFRLERAPVVGDFTEVARPGTNATTWSDTQLQPTTAYRYRIRACAAWGCSAFSSVTTVSTDAAPLPPPPAPTGLWALAIGPDRIDLGWIDATADETGFHIERRTAATAFAHVGSTGADTPTWSNTELAAGTTYTYRVRACTEVGCSEPSSEVSATTDAAPPGGGLGPGASLGGWRPFPADNPWNTDISALPVDANSATLISACGDRNLHPDFGTVWNGAPIGIPYTVVAGSQPRVPVSFQYADESDPGPYPVPPDAPIEGGPSASGDRHVIVIDRDHSMLYEMFDATPVGGGTSWTGGAGAVFDLTSNALRPAGWTSADAAGLPIFPGLVRYDEAVEVGVIAHALRFTCPVTRRAYVTPARHWASSNPDPDLPPMGMRVRLKASFDISGFPAEVRVILLALKTYGMFLADNGSGWYISGAPDSRWDDSRLGTLKSIPSSAFEVVQMGAVVGGS